MAAWAPASEARCRLGGCCVHVKVAFEVEPARLQDPPPLPFRGSTPHTVVDPVAEGVLEAFRADPAADAEALRDLDADAVAGEEQRGGLVRAVALRHPIVRHAGLRFP